MFYYMARPPLHLVTYPEMTLSPASSKRSVTVKIPYAHLNYSHTIEVEDSLSLSLPRGKGVFKIRVSSGRNR